MASAEMVSLVTNLNLILLKYPTTKAAILMSQV
eukprot:CAMPEP_0176390552 /NCGR_PEP_ID=MMETSP0126-20121128/39260_1 /TAXON_ID=141414 ORGANISM="Strombidinopsis acuminatum, Strain SPMC142" /NCGR_SAMPLE_ID=MMETSP0126 /ASSEMBLY_ACC=CAM_ASM_000229 /LENGTH=32 /DNA_ID= /DNA_START= /DNA_END= /DNA_ORIENTATION=